MLILAECQGWYLVAGDYSTWSDSRLSFIHVLIAMGVFALIWEHFDHGPDSARILVFQTCLVP